MLKLTLRPGEYLDIGKDIRVVFAGGSANNIRLMVDAPRQLDIIRSSAVENQNDVVPYYKEHRYKTAKYPTAKAQNG